MIHWIRPYWNVCYVVSWWSPTLLCKHALYDRCLQNSLVIVVKCEGMVNTLKSNRISTDKSRVDHDIYLLCVLTWGNEKNTKTKYVGCWCKILRKCIRKYLLLVLWCNYGLFLSVYTQCAKTLWLIWIPNDTLLARKEHW